MADSENSIAGSVQGWVQWRDNPSEMPTFRFGTLVWRDRTIVSFVEQPVADDSPLSAGSDVKSGWPFNTNFATTAGADASSHKYDTPRLNITINLIGCLELSYGKDRFAVHQDDVYLLSAFLGCTEPLWSKAA